MVQDPNFWKRFSTAVHQDDLAKQEMTQRPEMKQSYVTSSHSTPSVLSPLGSPSSQSPLSLLATHSPTNNTHPPHKRSHHPKRTRSRLQKTPSTKPLLRPQIAQPTIRHPSPTHAAHPLSPPPTPTPHSNTQPTRSPYRSANPSTFSLTGRPPSRFRFWTTITADPSHSDTWLEAQRRKSRQRTWICWAFWVVLGLVVAGVVVAVLVLRAHGIL